MQYRKLAAQRIADREERGRFSRVSTHNGAVGEKTSAVRAMILVLLAVRKRFVQPSTGIGHPQHFPVWIGGHGTVP